MNKKSTFKGMLFGFMLGGLSFFSFGQIVLQEGFEGATFPPTGWLNVNMDTSLMDDWAQYSAANAAEIGAVPHSGNFYAASSSYIFLGAPTPFAPDNWLITPQINIPTANLSLNFWAMGTYGIPQGGTGDFLEVYVSTTGTNTTDFTSVFSQTFDTEQWENITVDLAAYVGQNIYIAFRHYNSVDQWNMALDDILVSSPYEDLALIAMQNLNEYTVFPDHQGTATLDLAVQVANTGSLAVASYSVQTNVYMDGSLTPVQTFTTPGAAMNIGDTVDLTIGTYTASTPGDYSVFHVIVLGTDAISSNDSISDGMTVSTGEYARDRGNLAAISGFPGTTGVRGNTFEITNTAVVDSVLFAFDPSVVGVRVIAEITRIDGTDMDTVTIGKSLDFVVDQTLIDLSTANGGVVVMTVPVMNLLGNNLKLDPGTYFVGLRKPDTLASMRLWFATGVATSGGSLTRAIGGNFVDILTTNLAGYVPIIRPYVSLFDGPSVTSSDADNTVCAGQNIILTSSIATGNVWSTGETTKSIVVSTNGSYTVTANGFTSDPLTLTFLATDAITLTETNPTTCAGTDGSIAVSATGAGTGTITWTGTTSGSMPIATVTGLSAGGYSFVYVNENGCTSPSVSVSLNDPGAVIPVVSAGGSTSFCPGGSVVLTSSTTGGNVWSTTETTDAITVSTSGFFYVVNTTAGCVGTSNVVEVTANPLPTVNAGADMSICSGEMVFLFGSGAATYAWDNGVTDGVGFPATATTTYTVTGTDANGCVNTDAITVTVNASPVITFDPLSQICVYNAARALTALPAGGIFSGTGVVGSNFDPTGLVSGTYTISYDVTVAGCSSTATQTIAVDSCLNINTLDQAQLSIYPNPTTGKFTVSSDNLNQYDVIELRDQLGRTVGTWKINNTIMNIETKNIAKGNYLLVVRGNKGDMMKKIQLMD